MEPREVGAALVGEVTEVRRAVAAAEEALDRGQGRLFEARGETARARTDAANAEERARKAEEELAAARVKFGNVHAVELLLAAIEDAAAAYGFDEEPDELAGWLRSRLELAQRFEVLRGKLEDLAGEAGR